MRRILWNERGGDIDEVVLTDVAAVHIEQMNDNCWWIGVDLNDGGYWSGNFSCPHYRSKQPMKFTEQEQEGFTWDDDDAHREVPT